MTAESHQRRSVVESAACGRPSQPAGLVRPFNVAFILGTMSVCRLTATTRPGAARRGAPPATSVLCQENLYVSSLPGGYAPPPPPTATTVLGEHSMQMDDRNTDRLAGRRRLMTAGRPTVLGGRGIEPSGQTLCRRRLPSNLPRPAAFRHFRRSLKQSSSHRKVRN